jgi:hypothetical protein
MYGHEQPVGQAVSADYSHEGAGAYGGPRLAGPRAPSTSQHGTSPAYGGVYPPYPQSASPAPMQGSSTAPPEKPSYQYQGGQQPASPTYAQPQRQQFYVQNPSTTYEDPYVQPQAVPDNQSLAPTYRTHEASGAGGLQYHSSGGHDMYGMPRY